MFYQYCQATGTGIGDGKLELKDVPSPRTWQYNLMGHPPRNIVMSWSELNTWAFTIKLIVSALVFSSDQFLSWWVAHEGDLFIPTSHPQSQSQSLANILFYVLSCKTLNTKESIQMTNTQNRKQITQAIFTKLRFYFELERHARQRTSKQYLL